MATPFIDCDTNCLLARRVRGAFCSGITYRVTSATLPASKLTSTSPTATTTQNSRERTQPAWTTVAQPSQHTPKSFGERSTHCIVAFVAVVLLSRRGLLEPSPCQQQVVTY